MREAGQLEKDVNNVTLTGTVVGEPTLMQGRVNVPRLSFTLEQVRGGSKAVPHRFRCVAFGPLALDARELVASGRRLLVVGELAESRAKEFARRGRPGSSQLGSSMEVKVLEIDALRTRVEDG